MLINVENFGQWSSCNAINTRVSHSNIWTYGDYFDIVEGENGVLYLAWTCINSEESNEFTTIQLQKINKEGKILWSENGMRVSNATGTADQKLRQWFPKVFSDGNNGVVVIWSQLYDNMSTGSIYVQKIDSTGKFLSGDNGSILMNITPSNFPFKAIETKDKNILVFDTKMDQNTGEENRTAYVQKTDHNGTKIFAKEKKINTRIFNDYYNVCADNDNGAFITWQQFVVPVPYDDWTYEVCVQKISPQGQGVWSDSTIRIARINDRKYSIPVISSDGTGGVYVLWVDRGLQMQHLDANGTKIWNQKKISNEFENFQIKGGNDNSAIVQFADSLVKFDYYGNIIWIARLPSINYEVTSPVNYLLKDNNEIYVTWNELYTADRYSQLIGSNGDFLWNNTVNYTTEGFNDRLTVNKSGDLISCWIKNDGNFYMQKILKKGSLYGEKDFAGNINYLESHVDYGQTTSLIYNPKIKRGEFIWEVSTDSTAFSHLGTTNYYDSVINTGRLYNKNYFRLIQVIESCKDTSNVINVSINPLIEGDFFNSKEHFVLFPNPFHNHFIISTFFRKPTDLDIEIYDSKGATVFTETLSDVNDVVFKEITWQDLKKGIYFVKLTANKESFVKKVINN